MITINNRDFKSNMRLCSLFNVLTKDKIVNIISKLDEYISPNLKKADTAIRAANMILCDPMLVLEDLTKDELKLVKEFVDAGPNQYIIRKMRKTQYKLQKYALVATYEDFEEEKWHMIMPDEVREAFAIHIDEAIAFKEKHPRKLTHKEKSMIAFMEYLNRNIEK